MTLQFHNGGGVLTGQLGELYARRKSASRLLRAEMAVQKPLSHLATARSREQLRRLERYFRAGSRPSRSPATTAAGRCSPPGWP